MEQMTAHERITLALAGEAVDRTPFCPFLAYVWEHFPKAIQERGQPAFLQEVGADPMWRGAPCPVRTEVQGAEQRQSEHGDRTDYTLETPVGTLHWATLRSSAGNTAFLVEHPLKTAEDFRTQQWVEEHRTLICDPTAMREHLQGAGREGLSVGMLVPRGKTAFQSMVEHYVGTEELVYALADYPEVVEELWQVMMRVDLQAAEMAAEADYEYFLTWEDSSTQNYSPTLYDRYIAPEVRRYCEILQPHGKRYIQHACGHVRALVPRMREAGVFAVESLSPPPTGNVTLREARAMAGSAMGIIGGIEPTLFLTLSMTELETYVEQVIEDGAGGPFVLGNSDSCPPGVTPEKFRLIGDIVRRVRC